MNGSSLLRSLVVMRRRDDIGERLSDERGRRPRLDVARIRRRAAGGLVGPGLDVVDRIDNAAAELAESRAAAVATVFFQLARRDAEYARGLVGARRGQSAVCRGHGGEEARRWGWTKNFEGPPSRGDRVGKLHARIDSAGVT